MSKTLGYETVMMCATDAPVNAYGRRILQAVPLTMSEALGEWDEPEKCKEMERLYRQSAGDPADEQGKNLAKPLSRLARPVGRK